jgi:hypothetical protein
VKSTGISRHRTKMFHRNILVQEHDGGLAPGVEPKPPHARKHWADEKRYPHAELEEHNHIGLASSRRSKEAFVQ